MSPITINITSNKLTSKDINFEIIKNEFNFHYKNIISINNLPNTYEITNLEYSKTILNYFEKDKSSILFKYNNLIINQIEYCISDWKKSLSLEFSTIDKYILELSKLNDSINHTMSLELKLINFNTTTTKNDNNNKIINSIKDEYINLKIEIFKNVKQIIEKRKLNFDLPLSNIQLSLPNLYQNLKLIYLDSIELLKEQQKHSKNNEINNSNTISNNNINNNKNNIELLKPDNSFLNSNYKKPLPSIPKIYKQLPSIPTTTTTTSITTNTRIQLRPAPIPKELQR